jgi:hypothetical protein
MIARPIYHTALQTCVLTQEGGFLVFGFWSLVFGLCLFLYFVLCSLCLSLFGVSSSNCEIKVVDRRCSNFEQFAGWDRSIHALPQVEFRLSSATRQRAQVRSHKPETSNLKLET